MQFFNEEELDYYIARNELNSVLHYKDQIQKEYEQKLKQIQKIVNERQNKVKECLKKLPDDHNLNK
jgi:hypothetical protein